MNFKKIFKPAIIVEWTTLLREKGVKEFIRVKGWKVVAAICLYYLIRDTLLYIVIPFMIAQGFICGK